MLGLYEDTYSAFQLLSNTLKAYHKLQRLLIIALILNYDDIEHKNAIDMDPAYEVCHRLKVLEPLYTLQNVNRVFISCSSPARKGSLQKLQRHMMTQTTCQPSFCRYHYHDDELRRLYRYFNLTLQFLDPKEVAEKKRYEYKKTVVMNQNSTVSQDKWHYSDGKGFPSIAMAEQRYFGLVFLEKRPIPSA